MLRNIIKPFLFLPFSFYLTTQKPIFGEMKNNIDEVIAEKKDEIFIKYQEIENLIFNNEDLKSLKELEKSAKLNLSSTLSQKYPTIDLQANGLPKYVAGKNYNSNSQTTKTSQFSANPTLNISWDLIDPLRGSEIEIAKNLSNVQDNFNDIDIGSYPFFKAGKLGVSIVLRGTDQTKLNNCKSEIIAFVKEKKIEIVDRD